MNVPDPLSGYFLDAVLRDPTQSEATTHEPDTVGQIEQCGLCIGKDFRRLGLLGHVFDWLRGRRERVVQVDGPEARVPEAYAEGLVGLQAFF